MRLDVCGDRINVLKLLLTQRTREVLSGVYGGVVDERVLGAERVLALVAAVLLALAVGPAPGAVGLSVCLTQMSEN